MPPARDRRTSEGCLGVALRAARGTAIISLTNTELDVYGPSLHSINICIIIYSGLIYKVLSITCSRLLRGTYIDYNAIEFFRGIAFYSNICK